jgi:hypothetical protein
MKTYGGMDVQIYVFLTPALVGGEWVSGQLHVSAALPLEKEAPVHIC